MRQEPCGAGGRTLAALGIRRRVVEIAIDVENMNVFRRHTLQSLSRADHDTAVAPDQQRDVHGLLQVGSIRSRTQSQAIRGPGQLLIGGIE